MKIVEVIPYLGIRAGAEVFVTSLTAELIKNNENKITLIILYDKIDDSFAYLKDLPGLEIIRCHKKKGIDFKAAKLFQKIVNKIKPDIIHSHLSVMPTYFLAFGFKKTQWKLVHTVHSVPRRECGRLSFFLRKIYIKKGMFLHVGISDSISRDLESMFGKNSAITIYNAPSKLVVKDCKKEFTFIFVARFDKVKNHRLLIESFNEVWQTHKDITLVCVGNGPEYKDINYFLDTLPCKKAVVLPGATNDVVDYYCKSEIFVMSSIFEGNPISVLEALSCGLPVIAPKVGGLPDIIENENNGLLYERSNKKELIAAMLRLISDHNLLNRIKKFNLENSGKYSIEKCAEEHVKLFKKVQILGGKNTDG